MGVKISIDKHVSELDDILEMSPHYLSRVQFESKIGPEITQHMKVRHQKILRISVDLEIP